MASTIKKRAELIVFVANRLQSRSNYGLTLLYKALYFIDHAAYVEFGKPVAGFKYIKMPHGPMPAKKEFQEARHQLEVSGAIEERVGQYFGLSQRRLIAHEEADLSPFTKDQIRLMGDVVDELKDLSATEVSEYSHGLIGWQVAELGEEIPYQVYLLREATTSEEDIEHAKLLATQLNV